MSSLDKSPAPTNPPSRQIVGFSLPPAMVAEVKVEAARRNISLKDLFAEMWGLYKNNTKRSA